MFARETTVTETSLCCGQNCSNITQDTFTLTSNCSLKNEMISPGKNKLLSDFELFLQNTLEEIEKIAQFFQAAIHFNLGHLGER